MQTDVRTKGQASMGSEQCMLACTMVLPREGYGCLQVCKTTCGTFARFSRLCCGFPCFIAIAIQWTHLYNQQSAYSFSNACTPLAFASSEETIFNFVDKMEAEELCALMGSCLLEKLMAQPLPPLSKGAVASLSQALALKQTPANDNCEACKVRPQTA